MARRLRGNALRTLLAEHVATALVQARVGNATVLHCCTLWNHCKVVMPSCVLAIELGDFLQPWKLFQGWTTPMFVYGLVS